jgi:hypothetical protein
MALLRLGRLHARSRLGIEADHEAQVFGQGIRARIEREQWSVAIHPAGVELASTIINNPRGSAELQAHSMINMWLEKHPAQITLHQTSN